MDKTQQTRGLHGSESSLALSVRQQVRADTSKEEKNTDMVAGDCLERCMRAAEVSLKAAPTKNLLVIMVVF